MHALAGLPQYSTVLLPPPPCKEENTQLWRNLEWAKGNAPSHPHPEGPAGGIASRMVHPVVGVVDKVRSQWVRLPSAPAFCACLLCKYGNVY